MKTAILNNKEGLVVLQLPSTQKDRQGRDLIAGVVTLLPGLNLVDTDTMKALREGNEGVRRHFETKIEPGMAPEHQLERTGRFILEQVYFDKKDKDGKVTRVPVDSLDDALPLAKLTEEQCKQLVDEVLVGEMLQGWGRAETRPAVRFLIEKQIQKITASPGNPATAGR